MNISAEAQELIDLANASRRDQTQVLLARIYCMPKAEIAPRVVHGVGFPPPRTWTELHWDEASQIAEVVNAAAEYRKSFQESFGGDDVIQPQDLLVGMATVSDCRAFQILNHGGLGAAYLRTRIREEYIANGPTVAQRPNGVTSLPTPHEVEARLEVKPGEVKIVAIIVTAGAETPLPQALFGCVEIAAKNGARVTLRHGQDVYRIGPNVIGDAIAEYFARYPTLKTRRDDQVRPA